LTKLYAGLTPWQKTRSPRHTAAAPLLHYVAALITDFCAAAGDRKFGDDAAIVGGSAASTAKHLR